MKHTEIPLTSPSEWKDALRDVPHTFSHTWEHCHAMRMTTGFRTYLYVFEHEGVRIVSPIAERDFHGYTDIVKPYGFSGFVGTGACPDFRHYWKEFVKGKGYVCGYLGLNPVYDRSSEFDPEEIVEYDQVYVIDLTRPEQGMLDAMSKSRRRQLRNYENDRAAFLFDKPELKAFFLDHYHEFLRSRNASPYYYFNRETLSYLCDLDNVFLVGSRTDGNIVAVSLFGYTRFSGDYLFNVSVDAGKNHAAALVWSAVLYLQSLQVSDMNLGGGGRGMAEFKRRFGGRILPLKGLRQTYDVHRYVMLCRMAGTDPREKTGFFPAYREHEYFMEKERVRLFNGATGS